MDGTLAYRAESGVLVGTHTAIVCRTVDAFGGVAASFIDTYGIFLVVSDRSGVRRTFLEHVFPLGGEVDLGTDVLFPRFHVQRIGVGHHIVVVEVFVGKASEAMSELMYHDGAEHGVMGGRQRVGVVDTSATVLLGIRQDDDMLVRDWST